MGNADHFSPSLENAPDKIFSKQELLNMPAVKFAADWLNLIYEEEPWVRTILEQLAKSDQNSEDFLEFQKSYGREMHTYVEKRVEKLFREHPAFQVGNWDYLKTHTNTPAYNSALTKVIILMRQGRNEQANQMIEGFLKNFTWYPTEGEELIPEELDNELFDKSEKQPKAPHIEANLELKRKAIELRKRAKELIHPPDYITQHKVRSAVTREKAEIHAETWEELVDLAEGARKESNPIKYMAIAQKLAETYNENELFNHTQYTRKMTAKESADGKAHEKGEFFATSPAGIENFRVLIIKEGFRVSDQASMRFMADMTDIAEQHNHHGIMRSYGSQNGKYYRKSDAEREAEVSAEKGKMETGLVIGRSNRLSGYDEIPALDYALSGTRVDLLQENQLDYYIKNWNTIKFLHQRGQLNPNQARAAAMPQNAARIIARASELPSIEIEAKDANGQPLIREVEDPENSGKNKRVPVKVNQRSEALRVLKELFIAFGEQQITAEDLRANNKAFQELLDQDKIEQRYAVAIQVAQINLGLDSSSFKVFKFRVVPAHKAGA
jgi:hypothetical protein